MWHYYIHQPFIVLCLLKPLWSFLSHLSVTQVCFLHELEKLGDFSFWAELRHYPTKVLVVTIVLITFFLYKLCYQIVPCRKSLGGHRQMATVIPLKFKGSWRFMVFRIWVRGISVAGRNVVPLPIPNLPSLAERSIEHCQHRFFPPLVCAHQMISLETRAVSML